MGDRPGIGTLDPLPMRNPKLAVRVINGEAMMLTPHDSVLHTLNPVATRIWQLLPSAGSLTELADALVNEFDVERSQAEADLQELLGDLVERRILVAAVAS